MLKNCFSSYSFRLPYCKRLYEKKPPAPQQDRISNSSYLATRRFQNHPPIIILWGLIASLSHNWLRLAQIKWQRLMIVQVGSFIFNCWSAGPPKISAWSQESSDVGKSGEAANFQVLTKASHYKNILFIMQNWLE